MKKKKQLAAIHCDYDSCNKIFKPWTKTQRYCTVSCRQKADNERRFKKVKSPFTDTGATGAYSELAVAMDLLKKGYYVFRSMSQHSPCDLIAFKNGDLIKYEVKTGSRSISGTLAYPKGNKEREDRYDYDVLAIYDRTSDTIEYIKVK